MANAGAVGEPDGTPGREPARPRRRHPVPSPAVLALRLENLQRGHRAWRARRDAAQVALQVAMPELPVEELWQRLKPRVTSAVALHLAGFDYPQIAAALGYSGKKSSATTVQQVLRRPEAQRLIREIRQQQLERVLAGTYGVAAAAQAAAPAVIEHIAELAGGQKTPAGERRGRARRDADAIRAGELVLGVAGHKTERHVHAHVHVLEQLNDTELEHYAATGEWPERYASLRAVLPPEVDALPSSARTAPPGLAPDAPAAAPDEGPTRRPRGRR